MSEYTDNIRDFSDKVVENSQGFVVDLAELDKTTTANAQALTRVIKAGEMLIKTLQLLDEAADLLEAEEHHSGDMARQMESQVGTTRALIGQAAELWGESDSELVNQAMEDLAGSHRKAGESAELGTSVRGLVKAALDKTVQHHATLELTFFGLAELNEELKNISKITSKAIVNSGEASMLGLDAANKLDRYADNV